MGGRNVRHPRTLPGSDIVPQWTPGVAFPLTLLAAGQWPHLRIPALAHYGVPTKPDSANGM